MYSTGGAVGSGAAVLSLTGGVVSDIESDLFQAKSKSMFSALVNVTDAVLTELCVNDGTVRFEIEFLQRLIDHANRLRENIDDNALTCVIKKQILKITALLVRATDNKVNGAIDELYKRIADVSVNDLEEMQIMNGSKLNEYTMSVAQPCLPRVLLSQIGGIPASCGLHAVMHMLLSIGLTSNFFDFTEIAYQRCFAHGFNRLNNGEMCTVMSEINDVLRSFADTLAAFIPPARLYAAVGTKGVNDYNFCDFLKPSVKANFGIKKGIEEYTTKLNRTTEMSVKDSIIYDIEQLHPEWLLFDIGMWCAFADGINVEINVTGNRYRLHSFIANTGFHYICCVLDMINTERGPVNVVRIYDDMSINSVRMAPLHIFQLDSIGALIFHKL